MTKTKTEKKTEKPKRVREVYDTGMIAHLWANQSQEHARNPQNNLFFFGRTLYSYRQSYPIGYLATRGRKTCALIQANEYSATTREHIRDAINSLPADMPRFQVVEVDFWRDDETNKRLHARNWESYLLRIAELAGKAGRAKSNRDYLLGQLGRLVAEANAYSKFFGLRRSVKGADDLQELTREIAARQGDLRRAELKANRERQAKRSAELAESLRIWLDGGEPHQSLYDLPKTYLRISSQVIYPGPDRETVIQTSKGASFPVSHARKAFPLLKRLRDAGQAYEANGHTIHLGHFQIDSMDENGTVRAGCHTVEWDEIERIARQLKLID